MRGPPSVQSVRVNVACLVAWLALSSFCLVCAGCFWLRDYSAWSDPNPHASQYAILPVLPAQVRITVDDSKDSDPYEISLAGSNVKNQEEVARIINKVLDTMASGENNPLQGPGKMDSALKQIPEWKNLLVYLQDPGPLNEGWKREGLATISRKLGRPQILCVNTTLRFKPTLSLDARKNDPLGQHWDGRITVKVDKMDLETAQVVASGAGEARFFGHLGVVGFGGPMGAVAFPYAFGKAFDRAIDQAMRKALTELFNFTPKEGTVK